MDSATFNVEGQGTCENLSIKLTNTGACTGSVCTIYTDGWTAETLEEMEATFSRIRLLWTQFESMIEK